jgi:ABC-type antimicrobial peptide transport system permease subunit
MLEVVGIARNSKHRNMSEDAAPFLYLPLKEDWSEYGTLLVLTDGEPGPVIPIVRRELMAVDPNPPIYDSGTLAAFIRRQALVVERLMAQVMTGVGMIGLVLSVLGLYGVIAYSVSRRTHEIGIRIAIGATTRNVMRWVLIDGLRLSAAGIAVGLIVSSVLKAWLDAFFTFANSAGTTSITALVFAVVIAGSQAVMLLACYIPARRASLVDPNIALRCDY